MRTYKLRNVIYFPSFNIIGGVETFCYEMALKYGKDYDITVLYRNGDPQQMNHIAEVARVIRYKPGDKIICDVFIFGWGWDEEMFNNLEAKEIVQTFHADYINRKLNPCPSPKVTKRIGVAENTTNGIREHYDWAKDIYTIYNPYTVKKPKKVLNLISATRLTPEKGFERMKTLCKALDDAGIPFFWKVFTDQPKPSPHPCMAILPPMVGGIIDYIADADYLVQLSDTEGYSYTVVEALSVGTPVIATDFAVVREQGVENGKTGWILPMDMSDIPVKKIAKGLPKFTVQPRESHYETILSKGKCPMDKELSKTVRIESRIHFLDIETGIERFPGDQWETTRARAYKLEEMEFVRLLED